MLPDPLFGSELVAKFINIVMSRGKKSVAEKIVYGALQRVIERAPKDQDSGESGGSSSGGKAGANIRTNNEARRLALETFEKALDNVKPTIEVKSRRVGGSNYQVPIEVRAERRVALAMRWLVTYSNSRGEKSMILRLANEILDALQGRGGAVKKREDVHKMARANQAFAHYRW